jgi:HD-GYP domain-containing protein (c-di-GMP phosphodiesterase class II)
MLVPQGRPLTSEVLRALEESGIEEILRPAPGEDPGEFVHGARNLAMGVGDLKVGQRMTQPVFDSAGALLVEAGAVVTSRVPESLRRRGIDRIYVRRSTAELRLEQVQSFRRALRSIEARRPEPFAREIDASRLIKPEECSSEVLDRIIDAGGEVVVRNTAAPLTESMKNPDPLAGRTEGAKDGFMVLYEQSMARTSQLFTAMQCDREVDQEEISRLAREVVGGLVEDRDLLMNLAQMKTEYNYLLGHSLGVTVLSISVAAALGYDGPLVIEIGHAAYLHDIGMLRVPPEILTKGGALSQAERLQVRRHPVHGLDMLQKLVGRRNGLAGTIPITAYQSHERPNGTGYPKGRKDRVIHDFAKIVGLCDTFEALTSPRPWRAPLLPYKAMEEVILMASRRQVNPEIVRALLRCTSLFPVGSWVELTDGSVARVVAASADDYARPVVSVMFRGGQRLGSPERINVAGQNDVGILRPAACPAEVAGIMDGF